MSHRHDKMLELLEQQPEQIQFDDIIALIEREYDYTPTGFNNGDLYNQAGENSGSCKLFSWAKIQGLNEQQTLGPVITN